MGSAADEVTADGRSVDDDGLDLDRQSSGNDDETLAEDGSRGHAAMPAAPERLGRYTVLRRLGVGGMGVVYEALDEQVGRRVALKLLRGSGGQTERLRLIREAQALAQLSHPNVVQVFEVGTLGDRAYLVMELVDGTSLDRWLEAEPRGVRAILGVFLQAGAGLAAAHAAGLVHRDFKPGNVLVGTDGRVRVVDFGLARASAGPLSEETTSSATSSMAWGRNLTHAGAMLGTPAYMSPEQLGSEPVTAASDQFAFCVALYQALYDEHPFAESGEVHEVLHNVLYGHLRPPPARPEVPSRLRTALLRGLASDPHARWPAMAPLLRELSAALRPSGWRRAIAAAAVVLVTGTWAIVGSTDDEGAGTCTGGASKLAETWGPPQRDAVEQAFLGTQLPYAAQTWLRVAARLDDYGDAWRTTHAEACAAGPRDARELDLRMACLERLRGALAAQVEVLAHADAAIVEQAATAVTGLRAPQTCLHAGEDGSSAPDDPALAGRHAELASELDRAEALARSGKYHDALAAAEPVLADTRTLEHPSLEARTRLLLGEIHDELGAPEAAEQQLEQAYFLGQRLAQRELVLRAAERLVMVVGVSQQDHERGLDWVRHAEAALDGDTDAIARAELLHGTGTLRRDRGEYGEALRAHEESLALYQSVLAPDRIEIAEALGAIGVDLRKLDEHEEARQHHEQALAIAEAALGPAHPEIATFLGNLATAQLRTGHEELAASSLQRALAIREAVVGTDSVLLTKNLTSLSVVLSELGRHDEAEQASERAITILEQAGTQPLTLCAALINLANARHVAGRYEQAAPSHRRALARCEEAGLEGHLDFAQALFNFGETLGALHELEEADAVFRRALGILERSGEDVTERRMLALHRIARVSLERERFPEAIEAGERWVALEPTISLAPHHRAAMEWTLARACWGAGRRDEALAHAREADRRAASLGDAARDQQLREELRTWRAEHDPEARAP